MPHVRRGADGRIESLHLEAAAGAEEVLPGGHPEVRAFIEAVGSAGESFARLDAEFVRVIEDLIDTLVAKNIINITDLPDEAQTKLFSRKSFREQAARHALRLFGEGGEGIIRPSDE